MKVSLRISGKIFRITVGLNQYSGIVAYAQREEIEIFFNENVYEYFMQSSKED